MTAVLIIRPRGAFDSSGTQTTSVTEISVEGFDRAAYAERFLRGRAIDTLILEDLTYNDLSDEMRAALAPCMAGRSCPVVTRWTRLAPDDAR